MGKQDMRHEEEREEGMATCGLDLPLERLEKLAYIAFKHGKSLGDEILDAVNRSVAEFEKEHGKIPMG